MKIEQDAVLLRIFIGESDRFGHASLADAIVAKAHESGLAGATVLRGVQGFGARSRIHTSKILRLSEDLPVVIELVDSPERIAEFLPAIETMMGDGLVTMEKVKVLIYRGSESGGKAS